MGNIFAPLRVVEISVGVLKIIYEIRNALLEPCGNDLLRSLAARCTVIRHHGNSAESALCVGKIAFGHLGALGVIPRACLGVVEACNPIDDFCTEYTVEVLHSIDDFFTVLFTDALFKRVPFHFVCHFIFPFIIMVYRSVLGLFSTRKK